MSLTKPVATLFNSAVKSIKVVAPLADRMRPQNLLEFIGHEDVISEGKPLRSLIDRDQVPSLIFWGPPGSGKTTLARLIAGETAATFVELPAVTSGLTELRRVIIEARERQQLGVRTILFIDEIHRWNKAQQDALLPHVENGLIILIGATTENPSFGVITALLSRVRVMVLQPFTHIHLRNILERAAADIERGLGKYDIQGLQLAIEQLMVVANGDARTALNALELAVTSVLKNNTAVLTEELIKDCLQRTHLVYDRAGEEHYNIISALHKSMRGSDSDAALYWLGRMLQAGEDPVYVARRLVRFASEDVGLADPQALLQAVAALTAVQNIGLPECDVVLAQAVVYLSQTTKSNALYVAYSKVKQDVQNTMNEGVPLHLRNASTQLMKDLNYGKDYKYNPDFIEPVKQEYLPKSLKGRKYLNDK